MAQLHPPYVVEAAAVAVRERSDDHKNYSELFDFQCDILSQFPKEAGAIKGYERVIPFLPGKKLFQRSNRKLAESRLPEIDGYMREFVLLPEQVVQCETAFRFFRSNWQEDKLKNGEGAPLVSAVRYSVRTISQDNLLGGDVGSREGSVDSPTSYDEPSGDGLTFSNGRISGI